MEQHQRSFAREEKAGYRTGSPATASPPTKYASPEREGVPHVVRRGLLVREAADDEVDQSVGQQGNDDTDHGVQNRVLGCRNRAAVTT